MATLTYGRYTVEAVDLYMTSRNAAGRGCVARAEPVGDGPQLIVRRSGRMVAYVRTPDEALAIITGGN